MQNEKPNPVFELLAKPVRKALAELGFSEPTLPQVMAFPPVLAGKNLLGMTSSLLSFYRV